MRAAIIFNARAGSIPGTGKDFKREIIGLFGEHGIKTDFLDAEHIDAVELLSSGYDLAVVCGGDGTISNIAGILAGSSLPLGVIPSGTFNHFAKDNSIPLDIREAVKTIVSFKISSIDTGEVNGKLFINNSSIGLYPKMVKQREILGGNKWISMGKALLTILGRMPVLDIKIKEGNNQKSYRTPFVFVGNNEYKMDIFNLGSRASLSDGKLSIYFPKRGGKFAMAGFALLALINRLKQQKNFNVISTDEFTITSRKEFLDVAIDGEAYRMKTPLVYKINPLNLKIILPPDK